MNDIKIVDVVNEEDKIVFYVDCYNLSNSVAKRKIKELVNKHRGDFSQKTIYKGVRNAKKQEM